MQLREFAETILHATSLTEKLITPAQWEDDQRGKGQQLPNLPGRPVELQFGHATAGKNHFPNAQEMADPHQRGVVLHFFANHELLALELMALALLKFPDAPPSFRLGIARTMVEEQKHLQLYLQRMKELGVQFGEVPVNDFFWQCLHGMRTPEEYVTGMCLTFEQANLDFSLYYQKLFQKMGDTATAAIMDIVYREEIGHVKHGVVWFERLRQHQKSFWEEYVTSLQLPLSPARAKGTLFAADGRREAGLDQDYIQHLQAYSGSRGATPRIFWFNSDCEVEWASRSPGYRPPASFRTLLSDFGTIPMFLAHSSDIVLCENLPTLEYRLEMKDLGFNVPEFYQGDGDHRDQLNDLVAKKISGFEPWGWSRRSVALAKHLLATGADAAPRLYLPDVDVPSFENLFDKTQLPAIRKKFRASHPAHTLIQGEPWLDGILCHEYDQMMEQLEVLSRHGVTAVAKVPFSAAGQGLIRVRPNESVTVAQEGKFKKVFKSYGRILVEPWLERLFDMSILIDVGSERKSPLLGVTRFLTDQRGQYFGHILGDSMYGLSAETKATLLKQIGGDEGWRRMMQDTAHEVEKWLLSNGFRGRAGIDMFWFRSPGDGGKLGFRPINEINSRTTMGHIALRLSKRIAPGVSGVWRVLNKNQLHARGIPSFLELARSWRQAFPAQFAVGPQGNRIEKGIFFTNDPTRATMTLGVVAVGDDAVRFLESQEPKQSPYSRVFVDILSLERN